MRIKSDGKYEYRKDLYDQAGELLGESTRSKGLDASAEFTRRMMKNLERAADHPDMTAELAEILSTPRVTLEYRVESRVQVNE
ncbi:hypothetical protein ZOD2009_19163 [Haladaptatus paucihalophilus DX253]|uniref:DUF7692 domain-containing protein n=1 Tax=Haladaptatus paucihalophilus DX253 TaxID=797209 RepID=E7QYE2_HALPU|nr:hypothetical protein [Haladaptatus paucihalophilus]EFW90467.1 hypothetical protein ZOD2009_19163 [Haladaptatus paucihalophilus DX253]SHL67786.1 hypothetical protein SAMN05444342_4383 [Haladaptatus paucihalophilus DX253]